MERFDELPLPNGIILNKENSTAIIYLDNPVCNHLEYYVDGRTYGVIPALGSSIVQQLVLNGWGVELYDYPDEATLDWLAHIIGRWLNEEWTAFIESIDEED